jgi:putative mRNA 3-end processing factor
MQPLPIANGRPAIERVSGALRLTQSGLWLDSQKRRPLSFVSHAHGDHLGYHEKVIATTATVLLMRQRLGRPFESLRAPYGQAFHLGDLRLSLHAAGHVLGSAQLLAERSGLRLLYTGDLGLSPSLTAEPAEIPQCDVLVLESTFGHPRYSLPPRLQALEEVERFVRRTLARGENPVLLAYALGKSQEVIRYLGERGYPLRADKSIRSICRVYRRAGCALPEVGPLEEGLRPGDVLIWPPHRRAALASFSRIRTCMLSGWAVDPDARRRFGSHESVPLSDHSDFSQLVGYAERTGARRVFTVHGFAEELAQALAARGMRATPLREQRQLELFDC